METLVGFLKGMRQDMDNKLSDKDSYYEAVNKQIVFDDLTTTGAIADEPGNKLVTGSLGLTAQDTMIKTVSVRDWVISFIKNTSFEGNRIIKYKITSAGAIANLSTVYTTYTGSTSLGQWFGDNIDCVVRYRDENLCKLYWTDGINQLRHINIFADNSTLPISLLDVTPEAFITQPEVYDVISGGRLNIGRYQYAYQYYNRNGAETVYSQLSNIVDITRGSLQAFSDFAGGDSEDVSNKSALIKIENIDSRFEYIRVLSIYYKDSVTAPEIKVITELAINGQSTITVKDVGGAYLDIITPEELNFVGGRTIIPSTLTTKDNYLIAGNIKEEYFDIDSDTGIYWDARVYRFDSSTNLARVDSSDGATVINVDSDFDVVPITFDCVQTKVNQKLNFKYKQGTLTLGGTGKNISYEFTTKSYIIDPDLSQNTIGSPKNKIWNSSEDASLMRNEMYRFGIVFIKDGKYSFVKWIADILTPDWSTHPPYTIVNSSGTLQLHANVLGIVFTVNNVPNGYQWQIVRVPRNDEDKTILSQCVMGTVKYKDIGNDYTANHKSVNKLKAYKTSNPDYSTLNKSLVYLNSPEINYDTSKIEYSAGDKIIPVKVYRVKHTVADPPPLIDRSKDDIPSNQCQLVTSKFNSFPSVVLTDDEVFVNGAVKLGPVEAAYIENNSTPANFINKGSVNVGGNHRHLSLGNTSLIISLNSFINFNIGGVTENVYEDDLIVCNYTRDSDGIYGGNSFVNKLANIYVKVSKVRSGSITTTCYNGDTYLQFFEFLDHSFDQQKYHEISAFSSSIYIPLESSVNINHIHGFLRSRDYSARELFILQETNDLGKKLFPTGDASSGITTEAGIVYYNFYDDVYKYNSVFSRQLQARSFFPKPLNFEKVEKYDTRVVNSEIANTSLVDNWTRFLYTSYQDLDTEHGKLNKLYVFNNKLYGFQDKAVAIIGFNDRELVQSDASTTLTLGTGDRLTYHQYLTTFSGCKSPNSLIDTGRALYYFDLINKSFYRITDSIEDISNTKGLSRLFKNRNYTSITDVLTGYDAINSRVFLTIQAATPTTISFNERLDAFESLHTYYPKIYLNHLGKLYTTILRDLYIHGEGEILRFHGADNNTNTESSISIIVGDGNTKKTFTNLEFDTNVINYLTNVYADSSVLTIPVSSIVTSNSYQSVTKTSPSLRIRRRFRTWRYMIPKDNSKGRFVDYFLKVDIKNRVTHTATPVNNTTVIGGVKVYYLIPMI
jgi:hypothetical protein